LTGGWYPPPDPDDGRLDFPATGRNKDALWAVYDRWLPREGVVLELASGSGQHVVHFAEASKAQRPNLRFVPSDPEAQHRRSIAAWTQLAGLEERVAEPLDIDVTSTDWGIDEIDAISCINMIHIAPWAACEGLFEGASRRLGRGAPLCLYGPFMRDGRHTAPSNEAFDARLRARNPAWGVRDLDEVAARAAELGFALGEVVQMPANNLSVRFDRLG